MRFTIFHAIHPTFSTVEKPKFPSDEFRKVVEIEVDNLEDVFRLSQHVSHDWTTNIQVVWRYGTGANTRSTSVGDIVVDENNIAYLCESFCWSKLS